VVCDAVPACRPALAAALAGARSGLQALADDPGSAVTATLTLRHMLRIARRSTAYPEETAETVQSALMLAFMPPSERMDVLDVLHAAGFGDGNAAFDLSKGGSANDDDADVGLGSSSIEVDHSAGGSAGVGAGGGAGAGVAAASGKGQVVIVEADMSSANPVLQVGTVRVAVRPPRVQALVPETLFFDIPRHKVVLEAMLKDLLHKDHLLLMGNQGVGKNKLTDKLLMLLHREREYIQLHRDTTVPALTLSPSMRGGVVIWEDSPLVKAMEHGRVMVIDEFDKAPAEVVIVLKALLEDGEILLGDGRRFVGPKSPLFATDDASPELSGLRKIHPEFIVIALANRPGYPFLGNDFFREMGDVFACHAIQNPDQASEIALLTAYAPETPGPLLHMLTGAFKELRKMVDEGKLSYPYSTRELVGIVRHLRRFPDDSLGRWETRAAHAHPHPPPPLTPHTVITRRLSRAASWRTSSPSTPSTRSCAPP
jgi:hypothetical protein